MDWSGCPEVESIPGKMSGAYLVRGTRIPADSVISNARDGYSPEQLAAEVFEGLPVESARRIIAYADLHEVVLG